MLEISSVSKKFLLTGSTCVCLLTVNLNQNEISQTADPEAPLPFIAASNDELLDQIFVEEKSNRICRFMKSRKMKAWIFPGRLSHFVAVSS